VVSKSITVDFIKPVLIGEKIRVEGNVSKINSEREAVLQGCIYNDNSEICARSSSLVSLFSSESIRKMGFTDQKMLSDMVQIMNVSLTREY
jgi:acyl-CoA thioesterase FadM